MGTKVQSVVVALVAVASCLSCVKTRVVGLEQEPARNQPPAAAIVLDGESHHLATCWSGDRESFLGVDLGDDARDLFLRLVIDPMDGPRLRLIRSAGSHADGASFDAASCRELEAQVEPTGWRVNRVRDFKGELRADCTSERGLHLVARVAFSHCH